MTDEAEADEVEAKMGAILEQLAARPNLNPAVLDRTHYALQQLSH